MLKFIIRRSLIAIPQLFLLSVLIFLLAQAMPGDALSGKFINSPNLDPAYQSELRDKLGLNDPWHEQYVRWIGNLVQGELGMSYVHNVKVETMLESRIANTFWL